MPMDHIPSFCTVGEIYTSKFSIFQKRVVCFVILELGPVSNERSGNFTFYRGFHEFLNPSIFENITVFSCSCHFTEFSVKWHKQH